MPWPLYNPRMMALRARSLVLPLTNLVAAQQAISFPTQDGGRICADLYRKADRAVVLAHGGRFNKESWRGQAHALVSAGFGAWQSTSADSAAPSVRARLISIALRLRTMFSRRFAT